MTNAYLTIDDSPTAQTDALTGALAARDIPAVLYCIGGAYEDLGIPGQGIAQNPQPVIRAIQKGFVIGNHLYSHRRASELPYEDVVEEIEKTERLIDDCYRQAGIARPAKLLRFPHLDGGCGGWVVDYDAAPAYRDELVALFSQGLNISLDPPTDEQREKKQKLQDYLAGEGFTTANFKAVHYPWYEQSGMAAARDALYTYSTADWMLNPAFAAFAAAWPYRSLDDLKQKIDDDPYLADADSADIILMHDHEGLMEQNIALIDYMRDKGIAFQPIL